jgi:hypothetical protein
VFEREKAEPEDPRPFWVRLLNSIRPDLKANLTYFGIKGKAEF